MCFSVDNHKEASQTISLKAFSEDHFLNDTLHTLYMNQVPSIVRNLVFTLLQKIQPGIPPSVTLHSSVRKVQGSYTVYIIVHCSYQVFKNTLCGVM